MCLPRQRPQSNWRLGVGGVEGIRFRGTVCPHSDVQVCPALLLFLSKVYFMHCKREPNEVFTFHFSPPAVISTIITHNKMSQNEWHVCVNICFLKHYFYVLYINPLIFAWRQQFSLWGLWHFKVKTISKDKHLYCLFYFRVGYYEYLKKYILLSQKYS